MRVCGHRGGHRERLVRVVGMRNSEQEIDEGVELAVGADAERNAGYGYGAKGLILRASSLAESCAHPRITVGEVARIFDDNDAESPSCAPQISREPFRVLQPRP